MKYTYKNLFYLIESLRKSGHDFECHDNVLKLQIGYKSVLDGSEHYVSIHSIKNDYKKYDLYVRCCERVGTIPMSRRHFDYISGKIRECIRYKSGKEELARFVSNRINTWLV